MDERLRKELLRSELKERNKGKKIIRCKYRPKYPDSAEREYVRLINAYMTIEKEVLMKYIPEIREDVIERNVYRSKLCTDNLIEQFQ